MSLSMFKREKKRFSKRSSQLVKTYFFIRIILYENKPGLAELLADELYVGLTEYRYHAERR